MTPKEKEFVLEYLSNGYNAQKAYRTIYQKEGKTDHCYIILNKPEVKAFIQEYRGKRLEAMMVDSNRIMEKLTEIAFAEKGDKYYRSADQLKALDMLKQMLGDDKKDNVIKVIVNDNSGIE